MPEHRLKQIKRTSCTEASQDTRLKQASLPWAHIPQLHGWVHADTCSHLCSSYMALFWHSCCSSVNDKPGLFFVRAFVNALLATLHEQYPLCSAPRWVTAGSEKEIAPAPSPWRRMPARISCCFPLTHASLLPHSICLCNSGLAFHPAWHCLCQQLQMFRCGYLAGLSFSMAWRVE